MWILSGSRQRHPTTTSMLWWHCRCTSATAYSSDKCPLSSQLISISEGRSPIRHLGRWLVAGSSELSGNILTVQWEVLYEFCFACVSSSERILKICKELTQLSPGVWHTIFLDTLTHAICWKWMVENSKTDQRCRQQWRQATVVNHTDVSCGRWWT